MVCVPAADAPYVHVCLCRKDNEEARNSTNVVREKTRSEASAGGRAPTILWIQAWGGLFLYKNKDHKYMIGCMWSAIESFLPPAWSLVILDGAR